MDEELVNVLDFLDSCGADALFAQRETEVSRIPFDAEMEMYRFIQEGKPTEMIAFYTKILRDTPGIRIQVGMTSENKLRQMKYAAVSAVAIACRAAIMGGALESVAYARSDDAIMRIDKCETIKSILFCEVATLLDYARLVKSTKKSLQYSPVIRDCIDYIVLHSHKNLTLDEIADGRGYTKEYIAKLFRAQVGETVSDFVLHVRIKEAKDLLRAGKSCAEVANILGFSSQSYFIRQFKKETGMTPMSFVRTLPAGSSV